MVDGREKMGSLRIQTVAKKWCSQYTPTQLLHPANELAKHYERNDMRRKLPLTPTAMT
jgi:hypothetical protein